MEKRWVVREYDRELVSQLSAEADIPLVMANILSNRGLVDAEAAATFLNPQLSDLHDPSTLPDIDKAAERVRLLPGRLLEFVRVAAFQLRYCIAPAGCLEALAILPKLPPCVERPTFLHDRP